MRPSQSSSFLLILDTTSHSLSLENSYATALRPLRPFARIVRFNKPPVAVLVKRLKMICEVEGLKADSRSLNKLAEITGCDIRSCLNTLQVRLLL